MAFRLCDNTDPDTADFGHATAEDRKLKKELLEVLALKVPFRGERFSRNAASECSPVAGAIQGLNPC
jgi:hypothetical protein